MTTIHDNFELNRTIHLDNRLIAVNDFASLPAAGSSFLYEGASIYVKNEKCDFYLCNINGGLRWIPKRDQFIRSTLIYNNNISSSAIGNEFFLHFNKILNNGTDDSGLIGDESLIIKNYNSDATNLNGAVNFSLQQDSVYLIKCSARFKVPQPEDFRLKIYLMPSAGNEAAPISGTPFVIATSNIAGTAVASSAETLFSAEAIVNSTSSKNTISISLETFTNFTNVSMTNTDILSSREHPSSLGQIQIHRLKQTIL